MADNGEALAKEKGNESSLALAKHWNSTSWARAMPQKLNSRLSFFYWHSDACENTINKIKKQQQVATKTLLKGTPGGVRETEDCSRTAPANEDASRVVMYGRGEIWRRGEGGVICGLMAGTHLAQRAGQIIHSLKNLPTGAKTLALALTLTLTFQMKLHRKGLLELFDRIWNEFHKLFQNLNRIC